MLKVIRITNEPSFNKGVESYVCHLDIVKQTMSTSPKLEIAKDFSGFTYEQLTAALAKVKESFPNATVKIKEV